MVVWNSELCHPGSIGPDCTQLPPTQEIFLLSIVSSTILGPALYPVQWETQTLSPSKWLRLQSNLLSPSSKKIKNGGFNFTLPCVQSRVTWWVSTQCHTKLYCNMFLWCVICFMYFNLNWLLRHLTLFQLALSILWLAEKENDAY